jgi:hypothetical protein
VTNCYESASASLPIKSFQGAPGRFLVGVTGFVGEHPFFGSATPFAFLPANLFDMGSLRSHMTGLQLFNFVQ